MTLGLFHVVESFDGQAIESWLARVVRVSADQKRDYEWTFFCILPQKGRDEAKVRELGANVVRSKEPLRNTPAFMMGMRRAMAESRADVLHCQHDLMSGLYLLASAGLPFTKRIVHIHNTALALPTPSRIKARIAGPLLRRLCLGMADHIVGVSRGALEAFTRGNTSRGRRDMVIPGGVDTRFFRECAAEQRQDIRRRVGLDPYELVLLSVGRLVESKNPGFCLKVLKQLKLQGVNACLLLVGRGPLESTLAETARSEGFGNQVKILGWQDDVAGIMLASDVLLWTALESPIEGLGLVVLEAQAAGLPVVASRSIPDEAVVIPEVVHFIGLGEGAQAWASAVERATAAARPSHEECLMRIEASPCFLETSATALFDLYVEAAV